jgi:hypothetical protein
LIARPVHIHSAAAFASGLDLNSLRTRLDAVVLISALHNEIRVSIEIAVLCQRTGMLRQAGRQHVGNDTRHDRRSEHVIQTLQTFALQQLVYVVKEVVHVLHRHRKIFNPQVERKIGVGVELR